MRNLRTFVTAAGLASSIVSMAGPYGNHVQSQKSAKVFEKVENVSEEVVEKGIHTIAELPTQLPLLPKPVKQIETTRHYLPPKQNVPNRFLDKKMDRYA